MAIPHWVNMQMLAPYEERCKIAELVSLSSRREKLCAKFIGDIICGRLDCPSLLAEIKFKVPSYNTRNFRPLHLDIQHFDFEKILHYTFYSFQD